MMKNTAIDRACNQVGGQTALASALGVSVPTVNQWLHTKRPVPSDRCPAIEKATDGIVRCEDLRPDIDWAYLRTSQQTTDQQ